MNMDLDSCLPKAILEHRSRYVYTYPFKGAYRPLPTVAHVMEDWQGARGPLNVYVHIPFCDIKCGFCHLFTTTRHSPESVVDYGESVVREIQQMTGSGCLSNFHVESVYFGGGTPTVMDASSLDRIVDELRHRIPHSAAAELAIESAPERSRPAQLSQLLSIGFRRISFGVQSFDDAELAAMGRQHTAKDASRAVDNAHKAGFTNVNVDLIYGLGGQTLRGWESSLEAAVSCNPETITVYPLTFRSRTAFGKSFSINVDGFPSPPARHDQYELARELLLARGYRQLTMVAFARECGGNRHEHNEFVGIPTVGFGAGALSYGPNFHYTSGHYHNRTPNAIVIAEYEEMVRQGALPIQAGIHLDDDEHMRRYIVMRLLSVGLEKSEFIGRFGSAPGVRYGELLGAMASHGLIEDGDTRIALTRTGLRVSSLVADLLASERVKAAAASYG